MIELANLVPPELQVPGAAEMLDFKEINQKLRTGHQPGKAAFESGKRFLRQRFAPENFPQLYRYLGPIRLKRFQEIYLRYELFSSVRALLAAIANSQRGSIELPYEAMGRIYVLEVDSSGKIQAGLGPLLKIVNGVEAGRIRQCSECKRIFWAGRMDKFACTRQCVGRRRVRLWRERYAERYKLQHVKKADAAEATRVNLHSTTRRKPQ